MHWVLVTGCVFPLVCAAVLVAGCEKSEMTPDTANQLGPAPAKSDSQTATYVYECTNGSTFVTRIEGETTWLCLPTRTVSFPHVTS